ncbi:hypothetical protein ABEB36_004904 [Hypothenemus hampei]|uniref:RHD domain-containing protein n=1 Tax=Hypothenemus hampei TaxID=57062 RepID=A0ABD1EYR1_HYPHA
MHILPEKMMRVQFQNLGIQCVKKKEIELSLAKRQEIRVDPFKNGFQHKNRPTSIDLNAIRLCFQAYLPDQNGKMTIPLKPIVSDVIYDKKAIPDLTIVELCSCVSYVNGGSSLILLCEKIAKGDVEIHFFEEDAHGNRVWQRKADFRPSDVHKQAAIKFKTPSYHNLDISEPVRVYIQLYRPSDHMTSEALPFEYLPLDSGYLSQIENKKRKRTTEMSYRRIFEELSLNQMDVNQMLTLDPFEMQPSDYAMANQSFIHENLTPIASISPQCIIPECNASLNDGATSTSPSNNIHSQNKHQSVRLNNFNGTKVNVMSTLDRVNIEPNEEMFPFKNEMNENSEPTIDFPSVNSIDLQKQLKEIPNSEPLKEIGNLSLTDL